MKRFGVKLVVICFSVILVGCAASNPPRAAKPVKRPPPHPAIHIPKDVGSCHYNHTCSKQKVEKKVVVAPRASTTLREIEDKSISKRDIPKTQSTRKSKMKTAKQKFDVDHAIKQLKDL